MNTKSEKPAQSYPRKIPLAVKIIYTCFILVLVPNYLRDYGPTNFLYFCDVALLSTLAGMWLENSLLISMPAVGILVPQSLWLADFAAHLMGFSVNGATDYMFNHGLPVFTRGLSLFHGWLPLLLVWLLTRVGYDRRAFWAWTVLSAILVLVCYWFMPPAGAQLADANIPVNINYVYGFNDKQPQHWMNQNLYVIVWMAALTLFAYLPTHLALRRIYRSKYLGGNSPDRRPVRS